MTSSVPSEGKTSTACNLAIALAQAGENVVLIDADLRRPTIADVFTLSSGVGLTSVLLGDVPIDDALQPWRDDLPLRVLTAGPIPPNPAELIGSTRMKALITHLADRGATVVLDSPPLLPVTDAALLARASDGALVVTRAASTHTEQLAAASEALRIAGATVLGVVLNRVPRKRGSAYYGGYDGYRGYRSTTGTATNGVESTPPSPTPARTDGAARANGVARVESLLTPAGSPPPDSPPPESSPVAPPPGAGTLPHGVTLIANPIPDADHRPAAGSAPDTPDQPLRRPRVRPRRERGERRPTQHRPAPPQLDPRFDRAQDQVRWTAAPPAVRSQVLQPEPAPTRSVGNRDDIVINTDHPTVSRLDPVDDESRAMSTWHIDWGDLPALINSPRNGIDLHAGESGAGARHRN